MTIASGQPALAADVLAAIAVAQAAADAASTTANTASAAAAAAEAAAEAAVTAVESAAPLNSPVFTGVVAESYVASVVATTPYTLVSQFTVIVGGSAGVIVPPTPLGAEFTVLNISSNVQPVAPPGSATFYGVTGSLQLQPNSSQKFLMVSSLLGYAYS